MSFAITRRWIAAVGGAAALIAVPVGLAWAGGVPERAHHGPVTAEQVRDRMQRFEDRALPKVGATADQRARIDAILDEAAPRLAEHREDARAVRKQLREALLADTIDRKQLEKLRREALELADVASEDAMGTMADVAEILSPEQRAMIADAIAARAGGDDRFDRFDGPPGEGL